MYLEKSAPINFVHNIKTPPCIYPYNNITISSEDLAPHDGQHSSNEPWSAKTFYHENCLLHHFLDFSGKKGKLFSQRLEL